MKLRCKGKRMACVSTYVSQARKIAKKAGMTLVCSKVGKVGSGVFTYTLV